MKNEIEYINEPELTFFYNQKVVDPRDGLTLFGPFNKNSINNFSAGIIGSRTGVSRMKNWLGSFMRPMQPKKKDIGKPFYPGFEEAFGINLNFNSIIELRIDENKLSEYYRYSDPHVRVAHMVDLYVDRLLEFKAEDDRPRPNLWFVVIPDEVYALGRSRSTVSKENIIKVGIGDKKSRFIKGLFDDIDEKERRLKDCYKYDNHFHNQLKLKLLKHELITQIIRESTIAYNENEFLNKKGEPKRDLSPMLTDIAWNIATAVYYKLGGLPWKLGEVRPDVCYIGLVFKKDERQLQTNYACCAAQMFLDSGDGMVFKGAVGPWYNKETREYHLTKSAAKDLLTKALTSFKTTNNRLPKEVFIHGRNHFKEDEWQGFIDAVENVDVKLVGVVIKNERTFKLYRQYNFPILRGSLLVVNSNSAYLWSKGFVPRLQQPFGTEIPNPLSIKIVRGKGEVPIKTICRDILALTKLNYNSCKFCDGTPVTLKFANLIGDVLTTGPTDDVKVALPFRYYI